MNILIEELHGIGDTVCSIPKIKSIRQLYPDARICILTKFSATKEVIESSKVLIDEIIVLDIYNNITTSMRILCKLRWRHFDIMYSSIMTPILRANILYTIIKPIKWIALQKEHMNFDSFRESLHFVDAGIKSVGVSNTCLDYNKQIPFLFVDPEKVKKINHLIDNYPKGCPIIGICIGDADSSFKYKLLRKGKVFTRAWGRKKTIELINLLTKKNVLIILIGGENETTIYDEIKNEIVSNCRICNLVGKTSINESIALSSICDLQIGVDTGMQHIAAAIGIRTLSIFGPTNPKTHGAYGKNSYFVLSKDKLHCQFCYGTSNYINCKDRRCLSSISAESVYELACGLLHL